MLGINTITFFRHMRSKTSNKNVRQICMNKDGDRIKEHVGYTLKSHTLRPNRHDRDRFFKGVRQGTIPKTYEEVVEVRVSRNYALMDRGIPHEQTSESSCGRRIFQLGALDSGVPHDTVLGRLYSYPSSTTSPSQPMTLKFAHSRMTVCCTKRWLPKLSVTSSKMT